MSPIRPLAVLLCLSFAVAGTAVAQDDGKEAETEEKVEEVVEERAAEEDSDGEPADADVGEASYNTENCEPANDEGEGEVMAEGESDEGDSDADADGDSAEADADADAAGDVEQKDMDECERVVK